MTSDHTRGTKRRSVLLTVAALGAFVCLIGGTVSPSVVIAPRGRRFESG